MNAYLGRLKLDRTFCSKLFTQFFGAEAKTRSGGMYRITSLIRIIILNPRKELQMQIR